MDWGPQRGVGRLCTCSRGSQLTLDPLATDAGRVQTLGRVWGMSSLSESGREPETPLAAHSGTLFLQLVKWKCATNNQRDQKRGLPFAGALLKCHLLPLASLLRGPVFQQKRCQKRIGMELNLHCVYDLTRAAGRVSQELRKRRRTGIALTSRWKDRPHCHQVPPLSLASSWWGWVHRGCG